MASTEPIAGRCAAKVSISERNPDGGYCELPPMAGQERCGSHGGRAPQSKAAAERRLQEAAALAVVAKYGVPQHIDWHVAMQESLDETYGNVLALRDLVQQLEPAALTWGDASVATIGSSQFPGTDVTQAAGIVAVVELYGRERDRLFRMAHDCGKLGLEVRRQAFDEAAQQEISADFLAKLAVVVTALGHDFDDVSVRRVVVDALAVGA